MPVNGHPFPPYLGPLSAQPSAPVQSVDPQVEAARIVAEAKIRAAQIQAQAQAEAQVRAAQIQAQAVQMQAQAQAQMA